MHWTMWATGGLGLAMALAACVRGSDGGATPQQTGKVRVSVYDEQGKLVGPIETDRVVKSDAEWRAQLTPEQYDVVRRAGTERPGTCALLHNKDKGVYSCLACGLPLFIADTKFESGTGWPSFFGPIAKGNVEEREDVSFGMSRTEVECGRCGAHLGHVFNDGPPPSGLRYCMNGVALNFTPTAKLATLADPIARTGATTQPAK
ncbi:MAG: methionine-R-sulfoxide reductase [Phycisphaerales bacterium]|nr:methionine-R-sulfoxide reductase [Phycisphaerales bacterium]